jgi:hypothetical protein
MYRLAVDQRGPCCERGEVMAGIHACSEAEATVSTRRGDFGLCTWWSDPLGVLNRDVIREGDATSVGETVQTFGENDGDAPDLDAARGLVPAVLLGAALWAIAVRVVTLLW